MGRAENWPDPRSRKWKIGDIHSVGIHANISSSKVQIIRTTTVPTARSWMLKPFPRCTSDFDLTDLESQNLHTRCVLELCAGMPNLTALCAAVFKLLVKNSGGQNLPPPVRVSTLLMVGGGRIAPCIFSYLYLKPFGLAPWNLETVRNHLLCVLC